MNEPAVHLSSMQLEFLRRLVRDKRSWLDHVTGGWAMIPLCDELIGQLDRAQLQLKEQSEKATDP